MDFYDNYEQNKKFMVSIYRKLWRELGYQFDTTDYEVCEDEAYRLLTDEFRRISMELEKAPQNEPVAVASSPLDVFANKVKGAVRGATGENHDMTAKAAEKKIDSLFGALKKTIRGIVASEKALRSDEPKNVVLDKVMGALNHVVKEVPTAPLPMGIGDRIARNESRVFEAFVPKPFREQAIYILNKQPQFSHIHGRLYRPTARAPQRRTLDGKVIWEILESYFYMQYYKYDLLSYIKESNVREIPDSPGYGEWRLSPLPAGSDLIAAAIDLNDTKTIDLIKAILTGQFGIRDGHTGEPCPYSISPHIVQGIVKSDNEELVKLLIAFMMDAGLQEGVRQCVCENMDAGTLKAQTMIFRAIYENHLIRFSSVKRGLATQIGFPDSDSFDLERISEQVVESMHEVIEHPKSCYDYIRSSDDHLKVNMGFWGLGIRDVRDIADEVDWLLKNGTHEQIKYASHNVFVIKDEGKLMSYAKYIFDHYSDDPNMLSRWLRCFIYDDFGIVDIALYSKGIQDRGRWWEKVRFKCDPIPLEPYFQSEQEAREYYHKLRAFMAHFDEYYKGNAIFKLFIIAWMLQDVELLSELASQYTFVGRGDINDCLLMATYKARTRAQKKVLFDAMVSRNPDIREWAQKIMKTVDLVDEDYTEMREYFRLKTEATRTYLFDLFIQAPDGTLLRNIKELLHAKNKPARAAGLDLIVRLKNDKTRQALFCKARPLVHEIAKPTADEKIVIDSIGGCDEDIEVLLKTKGFGLYDPDVRPTPMPELQYPPKKFRDLILRWMPRVSDVMRKLDQLIEDNKERTYESGVCCYRLGETYETLWGLDVKYEIDRHPFPELWRGFYETEIKEFELLLTVTCLLECDRKGSYSSLREKQQEALQVFGIDLHDLSHPKLLRRGMVEEIIDNLYESYSPQHHALISELFGSMAVDMFAAHHFCATHCMAWPVMQQFNKHPRSVNFKEFFITAVTVNRASRYSVLDLSLRDYIMAYSEQLISKDEVYKLILQHPIDQLLLPKAFKVMDRILDSNSMMKGEEGDKKRRLRAAVEELYWPLVDLILKVELKRSEQKTVFSQYVLDIPVIRGTQTLVDLLVAYGEGHFERDSYYSFTFHPEMPKHYCFSYLLSVSEPAPGETAETFRGCLKDTDISDERLVELAMFNDRWLPFVEQYLGWDGLAMGIYYFAAHMDEEFSERKKAIIARYTPIPTDDLNHGAMDIQWFKEAHARLGEKHFELLYKSAKYLVSNNKHTRARKYADALTGKYSLDSLEHDIREKRNKDLLMAYALVPLEGEEDMKRRYLFIQEYRKGAKAFGGQRHASENIAADMAIRNLASVTGYEDDTRLVMRMEAQITDSLQRYFDWVSLNDEVEIRLAQSDEDYTLSLECRKGGKKLKSVPSKYGKMPEVTEFKEVLKTLREQFARTKRMCEEFMENGTELTVEEIRVLLQNRIAGPVLSRLVYIHDGQSVHCFDGIFCNPQGKVELSSDARLRVAHPYDLYQNGDWHFYQQYIFDHQLKQPFKQVFRELYLMTDDEREETYSTRFAGNQIRPRRAVGCLKGRCWGADYEMGLQKVYYRDNLVAVIYAMADWFSPSDIEDPTLEYVVFYDRKTNEKKTLKEIPPIIFSEVMRDVDLAVSVAHAGEVDPETSHSTIEMRRIIAEFNAQLFGLKNVSFSEKHILIEGKRAPYSIHLGTGAVFHRDGLYIAVLPVHSQHKGRLFMPFIDEDPKTAEIMSKMILFADDMKIKDPYILKQI